MPRSVCRHKIQLGGYSTETEEKTVINNVFFFFGGWTGEDGRGMYTPTNITLKIKATAENPVKAKLLFTVLLNYKGLLKNGIDSNDTEWSSVKIKKKSKY